MNAYEMEDDFAYVERPNKSQQKREIQALLALGKELAKLDLIALEQMALPAELLQALRDVQTMKHGAEKRQFKLICKLLRQFDSSSLQETMDLLRRKKALQDKQFHRTERWRDRLLHEDASAVTEFMAAYPEADAGQIRRLIRNAKREEHQNRPPKSARALFRLLRDAIAHAEDEA